MAAKLPRIPEHWKADLANDIESVTVEGSPPLSDAAKWEARAYFSNPRGLGWVAEPKDAVHGGIKVYKNGKFVYSIDAGPKADRVLRDGNLGKLVFERSPDSMSANKRSSLADDKDNGEVTLTPPRGVSPENFAQALLMAAKSYDDSLPYSLPPLATFDVVSDPSLPFLGSSTEKMPYGFQDHLEAKKYNSNSFLAGLLSNVGAGSNIEAIKRYIQRKGHVAPGIDNLVPRDRFRNW